MSHPLKLHSVLQDLPLHQACLSIQDPGEKFIHLFESQPLLPGVILLDDGKFSGMFSRRRFFEYLSRPYSLELFVKRPISELYNIASISPLVLSGQTYIRDAAALTLNRQTDARYEPILVQLTQDNYHLLDVNHLLLAHSQIHELALETLTESQQALFTEQHLAQVTVNAIGDGVITTDQKGQIRAINLVAERLTGLSADHAIGMPLELALNLIEETTHNPIPTSINILIDRQRNHLFNAANASILRARDGTEFIIDYSINPIQAQSRQTNGYVVVIRDVTQEHHLARHLAYQAQFDELTGLMNRRRFMECLEQDIEVAQEHNGHTLLFLDLDRFKMVNDTCGHVAGDALLQQISTILQSHVRDVDRLARIGSDEFALLLHDGSLEQGRRVAQAIRQRFQAFRFYWQEHTFAVGVSIGITLVNQRTGNAIAALSEADTACYWAKRQGQNRIQIFKPEINHRLSDTDTPWITQINRALAEDRFLLYYQPIMPVNSSIQPHNLPIEHYEVLLRMLDHNNKVVSPGIFLPVAERYNLMPAIDRWVIQTLFATQGSHYRRIWQQYQHRAIPCDCLFTVNLSGASINEEDLVDFIQFQLEQHQIPPELICFEITETVAISNLSTAIEVIRSIKALGCKFALDDFGSGMSSFGYLKTLPVDYLKIDGSFIKDIDNDAIAYAMVDSINHVGQLMGLQTIAEWVDSQAGLNRLQTLGINYAQGFFLAKPKPLSTLGEPLSSIPRLKLDENAAKVSTVMTRIKNALATQGTKRKKKHDRIPV